MNGKAILGIFLAASLAGNAAFLASAFLGRPATHAAPLDQLSLTQEQLSKFEANKRAFQDERMRAQAKMSALRGVFADEFLKDAPDRERLMSSALDMAQVQANMRPKVVDHLLMLHALLTPAQRAALADVIRAGSGAGAACPGAALYSNPGQER